MLIEAKTEMQLEQPQFYATLISHLSADDQSSLQGIMVTAETQAQAAQAAQLAQQQEAAVLDAGSATPVPSGVNGGIN